MNAAARIVFARQRLPADLAAGAFTALVLYAEYIGLGVVLGGALPSSSGVSLGITMVVGAVLVNCVLGLLLRQPLLAGLRTGSLAVLVAGMKFSTDQAQEGADRMAIALAALSVMLLVSSAVQLAGLLPRVRAWLCCTSLAWRKGFVFSTAVSIVVGLGTAQLNGCLRVSLGWTTLVVILSMVAAIGWSRGCTRSRSPAWVRSLAPFSTVIGVALASAGYYALVAPAAAGGWCDVVGVTSATGGALQQPGLSPSTFVAAGMSLPVWAWPAIALWGALLGLVLLFESLTSLSESRADTPPPHWAAHLKLRAAANLVCGLLGLGCSSLSLSRTNALIESSARTALALAAHGIALLVMLLFLQKWVGALTQLAVAVALLLLAIQMIDEDTRAKVWRAGYGRGAAPVRVRSTWVFLGVVALSMLCGSALHYVGWGFGGGPLIALLAGTVWTGWPAARPRGVARD